VQASLVQVKRREREGERRTDEQGSHPVSKELTLGRGDLTGELLVDLVADDDLDDLWACVGLKLVEPAGKLFERRAGGDVVYYIEEKEG
jgi:hypothetical protein